MSAPVPLAPRRSLAAGLPIVVTVLLHLLIVGLAGYFVTETIIAKKQIFEAAPPADPTFKKEVEHRLQVARKAGGSTPSPVSAQRIVSAARDALALPDMPELAQPGANSLSSAGFGAGTGAAGTGAGYGTSLGGLATPGRGFMSLSFLGITSQRASKIVFVVDVGPSLLDIRKGGFTGFGLIREQMMKLVGRLPPGAQFGVVLFESGSRETGTSIAALDRALLPATVANKTRLFDWLGPVNATPAKLGLRGLADRTPWIARPLPDAGLDDSLVVPQWTHALRCALELQPDTVYLITGSPGAVRRKLSDSELADRKRENDDQLAKVKQAGLDPAAVAAARNAALAKARAQLVAINARLKARGKPPFIVQSTQRIFQDDFQAALKRIGESIALDTTGWADRQGKPIWSTGYNDITGEEYSALLTHLALLQRALLKERAALNIFLFVGPDEEPKAMDNLAKAAARNGGKFELLTTRRLEELADRDEPPK